MPQDRAPAGAATGRCNEKIYQEGTVIGVLEVRSEVAEAIIHSIAKRSRFTVDWHFVAGRAVFKTLHTDQLDAVRDAFDAALPRRLD